MFLSGSAWPLARGCAGVDGDQRGAAVPLCLSSSASLRPRRSHRLTAPGGRLCGGARRGLPGAGEKAPEKAPNLLAPGTALTPRVTDPGIPHGQLVGHRLQQ